MVKGIIVNEHELGTCKMTQDLEESFLESCKHNNTTPDDLEYFRSYVWNLMAMIINEMSTGSKPEGK
jgi:hypothetical protein